MALETFDELVLAARQFLQEGNIPEAVARFEKARTCDATRPELFELMELYMRNKQWSQAVELGVAISQDVWEKSSRGILDPAEAVDVYLKVLAFFVSNAEDRIPANFDRVYWELAKCDMLTV